MQTNSTDPDTSSFSRFCVQAHGGRNDTFLVAHEERGQSQSLFTCIQFLRRAPAVVQIKQAVLSTTLNSNLCSRANLKLDGWLIIDTNSVMEQRADCILRGGFNMQVYDKSTYTGVCDGYLGETRLESECLPGEGLNFYFRQAVCVPDGLFMYHTQRTYCLANWVDEGFYFILLRHDTMTFMWLLRYPQVSSTDEFIALLLKDLYATSQLSISVTDQYLQLTMSRQSPKLLDSLCFDDYEICSVLSNPCSYSEDIARTCAKTCGFCSDTKPSICTFPGQIQGTWVDLTRAEKQSAGVHLNTTSGHIAGLETFHCISWNESVNRSDSAAARRATEQMVVTVSQGGCRPRYSCLTTSRMSNLLFMQMSETRLWPLVDNKDDEYDCSTFRYTDNKQFSKNPYRAKQSTVFLSEAAPDSVDCDLTDFCEVNVQSGAGEACSGNLTQLASDSFDLSLPDCPDLEHTNTRFQCTAAAVLPSNASSRHDFLLITKTKNVNASHTHCWVFPGYDQDTTYIVESEHCTEGVAAQLQKGLLVPDAIITKRRTLPTSESPEATTSTSPVNHFLTTQELASDTSDSDTPFTTALETVTGVSNSTHNASSAEDGGGGGGGQSVLVTVGVLGSLIGAQLALLCKCSC